MQKRRKEGAGGLGASVLSAVLAAAHRGRFSHYQISAVGDSNPQVAGGTVNKPMIGDAATVLRRYMLLCEDAQTTLYHGSKRLFKVGTILRAQRGGYVTGKGFHPVEKRAIRMCEGFLEQCRPPNALSRRSAVFMVHDPSIIEIVGGYEDHVYVVEPIGPVTRCNLYWYSDLDSYCMRLDKADDADMHDVRRMANGYWSAAPNDLGEPHRDHFEYLAQSARVISIAPPVVEGIASRLKIDGTQVTDR